MGAKVPRTVIAKHMELLKECFFHSFETDVNCYNKGVDYFLVVLCVIEKF
jgi:hypothetical protein